MQTTRRSRPSRHRRGFALLEVLVGIVLAALVIGAGVTAVGRGIVGAKAPNAANDGEQLADGLATQIEALAAYDPSFIGSLKAGSTLKLTINRASAAKRPTSTTLAVTVTGVTPPPKDGYTRSLGTVAIVFTLDGKTQSANLPIAALAPAVETHCHPDAGDTGDCIVK